MPGNPSGSELNQSAVKLKRRSGFHACSFLLVCFMSDGALRRRQWASRGRTRRRNNRPSSASRTRCAASCAPTRRRPSIGRRTASDSLQVSIRSFLFIYCALCPWKLEPPPVKLMEWPRLIALSPNKRVSSYLVSFPPVNANSARKFARDNVKCLPAFR